MGSVRPGYFRLPVCQCQFVDARLSEVSNAPVEFTKGDETRGTRKSAGSIYLRTSNSLAFNFAIIILGAQLKFNKLRVVYDH